MNFKEIKQRNQKGKILIKDILWAGILGVINKNC